MSIIIKVLVNNNVNCMQLSAMRIAEEKKQPHWVVSREEVELTEEVLGRGGWGEVKIAKFRGLQVAGKNHAQHDHLRI